MTSDNKAITKLNLGLPRLASGKVREIFDLGERLLFVATDRISAYDVIMDQGIPDKGKLLTGMSIFWFDLLSEICPNHLVGEQDLPGEVADSAEALTGRSLIVEKLEMLPIEFVIRGYLVGSGWKDYQRTGAVCGIPLPKGLSEAEQLPEPIFTPATKAVTGHDENISEDEAAGVIGPDKLKVAKDYALRLYETAAKHAATRGIILADTKFEFGLRSSGEVVVGDEVLTPDSSRFWPASSWAPGSNPPSFDKQFLRDWLDSAGWDRQPPPPALPDDVIDKTRSKYVEAYESITGKSFQEYLDRP